MTTFNQYIESHVAETRERNEQRKGTCIYYREGACASEMIPRCRHYAVGLCLCAGNCADFCHHYVQPAELRLEQEAYAE